MRIQREQHKPAGATWSPMNGHLLKIHHDAYPDIDFRCCECDEKAYFMHITSDVSRYYCYEHVVPYKTMQVLEGD